MPCVSTLKNCPDKLPSGLRKSMHPFLYIQYSLRGHFSPQTTISNHILYLQHLMSRTPNHHRPQKPNKPKPQNTEVACGKAVVISPFPTEKKHAQIARKHKGAGQINSYLRGLEGLHLALLMVGLGLQGPFQPKWSYESIIWAKDNCHGFGCPRAALGQPQDLADQPVQCSVPKAWPVPGFQPFHQVQNILRLPIIPEDTGRKEPN